MRRLAIQALCKASAAGSHLLDVTADLVRSGRRQRGMGRSVHGGENGANEVVVNHDAVQDGDGPLHTVLVLGVFKRRYDGDERSEALETTFNALGGRGG
jgi:hypothetical protein